MNDVGGVEQPKRIVVIFWILAAIVLGIFLEKVLALVFSYTRVNDFSIFGGWTLSTVVGFAAAAVTAVTLWRVPKVQGTSFEVALELRRVTWPSLRETRAATMAVVVATFIASIILGVFDFLWGHISSLVY